MIRVLVVDDSALMRRKITDILASDSQIEVIDIAKTGNDAIKKVVHLKPDVVIMDIVMPDIDGLTALTYIMNEVPTPVVIISANVAPGSVNALKAVELGAVDTILKPSGEISVDIETLSKEIITKVKAASRVDVNRVQNFLNRISQYSKASAQKNSHLRHIVAIGASTGGPKAIKEILPYLSPEAEAAFLIVQHMPAAFTKSMAQRMDCISQIKVKEAEDGDIVEQGVAYVAPGDFHMAVSMENNIPTIRLNSDPKVHSVRPSVSVMMNSVAECFGNKTLGVLLTGMGQDGVEGMRNIKKVGGFTLAEDESTCVVFGMPRVAIQEGVVDKVIPLGYMGIEIMKHISR
ncbi:MAG: chemotaxis response regulator protein-glutamate methylesterase [Candidatus Omnitrophica bacterium]|nr:chemotaxis response regulator protein-glutamate methylesterase [Candidatus Omnitrophota bacterium]